MGKITTIGAGYDNPKALLAALLERDDIEWVAVVAGIKGAPPLIEASNEMELRDLSFVASLWQAFVSRLCV